MTASPAHLHLFLLGTPTWQLDGREPMRLIPKDAALLAKLALDGPQPRTALCDLLWPSSTAKQAADNLRQRASRLHAGAGVPFIEVGTSVRLSNGIVVDVAKPEGLADELLMTSKGLLAGIDLGDHDALDRWLSAARLRVAESCAKALIDRAETLEQQARLHEALVLARRVLDWVPLSEQAWRRLMRLHYLRGDRAAAQEAYWQLHGLLRDELGTRPSAETMQLLQTIEAAAHSPELPRNPVPVSLLRPPVLVGRQAPWTAMATAWQQPQAFVLVGEAGIGKSRLLDDFTRGQRGLVNERARPGDQQSPDVLLGRLLQQIEQRFEPRCDPAWRAELARLHPTFGAAPTAPAQSGLLRHALGQWMTAAMQAGLSAVVIDDLHYADLATLEALRELTASPALAELRLGLASRPWQDDEAGRLMSAWLGDSHRPVRIDLQALSRPELSVLLASLALPSLLDKELANQLYRHAGGHPLYTLATLQHAVASGGALQGTEGLAQPESVQALLDARLRDLPAHTAQLLQVAAVGGADLSVERAAQLLGCPPLALSDAWASLEANNVLRGEAFSHDLVHEAALRAVPLGVQQALHRQWAALLRNEGVAAPARLAAHWERGQRWAEAGLAWHDAATAARLAGHLAEQTDLFARAAQCHARAANRGAQFDALLARLDGLQLRDGSAAVLAALPEVEALADTSVRHLQCRIARIEAWLDQGQAVEAAALASQTISEAQAQPELLVGLLAQHAIALAQCQRADEAVTSAARAVELAREGGQLDRRLKAANALMYVHWSAGRMLDAVAAQREELACAEAMGDRATAAASEGSIAALLAAAGDVPATHLHALRARMLQRNVGLAENSTQAILNHTVLGAAAAALGHFDDAIDSLQQAVDLCGVDAAPPVRGKACLTSASVWLTLGRADQARAVLEDLPAEMGPGMQMQSVWLLGRAALLEGLPPGKHWARFRQFAAAHGELPFAQGVVFEASYVDAAEVAIERLAAARAHFDKFGMPGISRAFAWRELVRWLELPGGQATDKALALTEQLRPHADTGLSAKCYPPEVWVSLGHAYERAGQATQRNACLAAGRRWLEGTVARLSPQHRAAFMDRNPANRLLLARSGSA